VTGVVIIERVKCVYDEMKITDMCTFSKGCVQNFKEPAAEGGTQMEYFSDWLYSPSIGAVIKKKMLWGKNLYQCRYCLIVWNVL
jgi:hypothetical protein